METDAHPAARAAEVAPGQRPLRIIHCFRSPIGGLFRHVRDLVDAQRRAGHAVGIICDSSTGGAFEDEIFDRIRPSLDLGLLRFPMRRQIAPSDLAATWRIFKEVRSRHPDILHGHGAKGGAYARTIGTLLRVSGSRVARIYTPHGGSLHYETGTLAGRAYFTAERLLERMTDAFIFVSRYEADVYAEKVGTPSRPTTIARNGLAPGEFNLVPPAPDARDFLYIGMLRDLKGPDVFIQALALIRDRTGSTPTAWIVGSGDDKPRYEGMVRDLGLDAATGFRDPMPAREAFSLARTAVVPSRAESMPYIVLEAIAARVPIVATRVGGVPEIFGPMADRLIPPGDAEALAAAMSAERAEPDVARRAADELRAYIEPRFSIEAMANSVAEAYRNTRTR